MARIRKQQKNADAGRVIVDSQLEELEDNITLLYKNAGEEVKGKFDKFVSSSAAKDKEMRDRLKRGEITEDQYTSWRKGQMFQKDKLAAQVEDLTKTMVHADEQAMDMVRNQMPEIYATSYNFGGYRAETMSKTAGIDYTSFTIYNADSVRRLLKDDPDLLPAPKVDIPKDERWNRQHMQNAINQGIVQGESVDKIADRLMNVTNMDRNAALRNARTAVNGAENQGRLDSMERVEEDGIPMVATWSCTHDDRTRESHILLDGTHPDEDGYFANGCRFPSDPEGEPEEVYNCRCSLLTFIEGIDHSKDDELYEKMMEEEYYDDWLSVKEDRQEKEDAFQEKKALAEEHAKAKEEDTEEAKQVTTETKELNLSQSEFIETLEHYVAGEGFEMNKYARGEDFTPLEYSKEEIAKFTDNFEMILDNQSLKEEVIAYRGTSYDSIIEATGMTREELLKDPYAVAGSVITERGFVSTTPDSEYALGAADGRVMYTVIMPEGTKAINQSDYLPYDVEEYTVQRNSDFEIIGAHTRRFDPDGNEYPDGGMLDVTIKYIGDTKRKRTRRTQKK